MIEMKGISMPNHIMEKSRTNAMTPPRPFLSLRHILSDSLFYQQRCSTMATQVTCALRAMQTAAVLIYADAYEALKWWISLLILFRQWSASKASKSEWWSLQFKMSKIMKILSFTIIQDLQMGPEFIKFIKKMNKFSHLRSLDKRCFVFVFAQ